MGLTSGFGPHNSVILTQLIPRGGALMNAIRLRIGVLSAWTVIGLVCSDSMAQEKKDYPSLGTIERKDPRLDRLVPSDARIERLAEGYDWSEGPVWDRRGQFLLFSDVPLNTVFRWKEGEGTSVFLKPSGYTGASPRGGEPGSNGLIMDAQGRLILCQHGDRCVARLEPDRKFKVLADRYEGKRFNSPNDAVFKSNGDLYFTDPPYGLLGKNDDPKKELNFNGVFRLSKDGAVTLLTKEMTYPNGIAFSPDEKTLYVANSDPEKALWMAFDVNQDGTLGKGKVFFDATSFAKDKTLKGLPDGMKVDQAGNVFATGPGGVFIFSPDGTHLGTLATGEANGNCAWGDDGSTLYIAADMYIGRVRLTTRGLGF
jgi:gluconolactonase